MAFVNVKPGELNSAAQQIDGFNGDLVAAANKLLETAQNLGSTWKGDEYDNFMAKINDLMSWYNEVSTTISSYTQEMRAASSNYLEMDQDSAAAIKG